MGEKQNDMLYSMFIYIYMESYHIICSLNYYYKWNIIYYSVLLFCKYWIMIKLSSDRKLKHIYLIVFFAHAADPYLFNLSISPLLSLSLSLSLSLFLSLSLSLRSRTLKGSFFFFFFFFFYQSSCCRSTSWIKKKTHTHTPFSSCTHSNKMYTQFFCKKHTERFTYQS